MNGHVSKNHIVQVLIARDHWSNSYVFFFLLYNFLYPLSNHLIVVFEQKGTDIFHPRWLALLLYASSRWATNVLYEFMIWWIAFIKSGSFMLVNHSQVKHLSHIRTGRENNRLRNDFHVDGNDPFEWWKKTHIMKAYL